MNAKYLEVGGRTFYAFEEPDFVGPTQHRTESEVLVASSSALPSIEKYSPKVTKKPGFWRRQFDDRITGGQRKFDWFFGVIMPSICFFFDPIVFTTTMSGERPLLGGVRILANVLSFTAILAMMAWLLFGEKLKGFNAVLSGLFAVSAGFSLLVGIMIAPYSLLGLIILIGALGFTPLFTSFVYFRNAVRTFRFAESFMEQATLLYTLLLSALASVVIPYLFNLG